MKLSTGFIALIILSILLVACGGSSNTSLLPTATPNPTVAVPPATPTLLPPPTVTIYPTGDLSGASAPAEPAPEGDEGETTSDDPTPVAAASQAPTNPPPPTQASTQDASLPDGVQIGKRLFFADFIQGWPEIDEPTAKLRITNGKYNFTIGPFDAIFINTTAVDAADTYAQVEISPETCSAGTGYGLLFRYVDSNNYYLITIFCDNTFSVVAKVNGSITGVDHPDGPLSAGIDTTSGTHILAVLSNGTNHTIYFDGEEIGTFSDSLHPSGDVAIYAASTSENMVKVAFDNLEVWSLP